MHLVTKAAGPSSAGGFAQAWLMRPWRALRQALARPRLLDPSELSPHLLRDIGFRDGRAPFADRRP